MPSWPVTLPASPLLSSYSETLPETAIRTEMDQGPAKTRQRSTAGVARLTLGFLLSKAQCATLETFFLETLKGGSLSFDYTHPRTANGIVTRFVSPPRFAPENGEFFRAFVELEVLP